MSSMDTDNPNESYADYLRDQFGKNNLRGLKKRIQEITGGSTSAYHLSSIVHSRKGHFFLANTAHAAVNCWTRGEVLCIHRQGRTRDISTHEKGQCPHVAYVLEKEVE